ncbi:MAG: hypothetical protein OEW60_07725 [Thiovulaceae bacterium]|nr:hypothetical protein [Sulfurimonadaceae bacterium]
MKVAEEIIYYDFKNAACTYQCHVTVIGADDSATGSIKVLKNGKSFLSKSTKSFKQISVIF